MTPEEFRQSQIDIHERFMRNERAKTRANLTYIIGIDMATGKDETAYCTLPRKVIHIDDQKPHLTINCGDSVHVVPIALIEDVIAGKKCFTQLEQWNDLLKTILVEWLDRVEKP